MIEDNITLVLKDIDKVNKQLKEVKKTMKQEEKIDDQKYFQLKKTLSELKQEIKDIEGKNQQELHAEKTYIALRELRLKHEEDLAILNQKLNGLIAKMPPKQLQLKFESDEGTVNVMIYPQMQLFMNGKKQKI